MFSIARSRYALPVQVTFFVVNASGVTLATIYNANTPDLYENNAHHKIGWIATWVMTAQTIMSLLFQYSGRSEKVDATALERTAFLPISTANMAQHDDSTPWRHAYRWSGDSGSPAGRSSTTLNSPRDGSPNGRYKEADGDDDTTDDEERLAIPMPTSSDNVAMRSWFRIKGVHAFVAQRVPKHLARKLFKGAEIGYDVVDRSILILGWIAITSGGVTLAGWMVSLADAEPCCRTSYRAWC